MTNKQKLIALSIVFVIVEVLLFKDLPFFWDAASKAGRATWLLDNQFQQLVVPTEMNSGHPPLWPFLLAFSWKLFGKSILISRLLLAFINLGVFIQLIRLINYYLPTKLLILGFILLLLEPTLFAQTSSLNNDMLLLFFTLLAYNSIVVKQNYLLLTLALVGALYSNLRGIPIFISIFTIQFFILKTKTKKVNFKLLIPYIFSGLIFLTFLAYQFNTLGWVISTPSSNYVDQRMTLPIQGWLRNFVVIAFDFFLYGKFLLFGLFIICVVVANNKKTFTIKSKQLLLAIIIFLIVLSAFMVPFSNPIGVRYFMIVYCLVGILTVLLIHKLFTKKQSKFIYGLIVFAYITGHFWVLPQKISQPWDASFAHLNYFNVEKKMINYLEEQHLELNKIGTYTPLKDYSNMRLLKVSPYDSLQDFSFENNDYIIHSNIDNTLKDEGIITLQKEWNEVVSFSKNGVFMKLYKKKQN